MAERTVAECEAEIRELQDHYAKALDELDALGAPAMEDVMNTTKIETVADLRALLAQIPNTHEMRVWFDDGHNAFRIRRAALIRAEYDDGRYILHLDGEEEE